MSESKQTSSEDKASRAAFDALCEFMNDNNWHFDADEGKLAIHCGAQGDDLPMEISVRIYPEMQLISLISPMPFIVPADRRNELAVAISKANNGLVDGNFDYKYKEGRILFRMTSSFMGGLVGKELFEYMLIVSCRTIDEYNDKFFLLCKNGMSIDEVIKYIE